MDMECYVGALTSDGFLLVAKMYSLVCSETRGTCVLRNRGIELVTINVRVCVAQGR